MYYVGIFMLCILWWVWEEWKGCYDYLYGFYLGEIMEISYGIVDKFEFMYVVVLGVDVFVIGKIIVELGKLIEKVKIKFICCGMVDWDFVDWY